MRPASVDEPNRLVTFTARGASFHDEKDKPSRYVCRKRSGGHGLPRPMVSGPRQGLLYYLPMPGETAGNLQAIAPRLERLVDAAGDTAGPGSITCG